MKIGHLYLIVLVVCLHLLWVNAVNASENVVSKLVYMTQVGDIEEVVDATNDKASGWRVTSGLLSDVYASSYYIYGDTIARVEDGRRNEFVASNDTLWLISDENRVERLRPLNRVAIMRLPMTQASQVASSLDGRGILSDRYEEGIIGGTITCISEPRNFYYDDAIIPGVVLIDNYREFDKMVSGDSTVIDRFMAGDTITSIKYIERRKTFVETKSVGVVARQFERSKVIENDTFLIAHYSCISIPNIEEITAENKTETKNVKPSSPLPLGEFDFIEAKLSDDRTTVTVYVDPSIDTMGMTFAIYDSVGRQISTTVSGLDASGGRVDIPLIDVPDGVAILVVMTDGVLTGKKIAL